MKRITLTVALALVRLPQISADRRRSRKPSRMLSALILTLALGGGWGTAAQAKNSEDWTLPMECGQALEAGVQESLRCLQFRLDGAVGDYAAHLIEQQGQVLFGDKFRFVHRLSWSPFSAGINRNLDAVIPLQFLSGDAALDKRSQFRSTYAFASAGQGWQACMNRRTEPINDFMDGCR